MPQSTNADHNRSVYGATLHRWRIAVIGIATKRPINAAVNPGPSGSLIQSTSALANAWARHAVIQKKGSRDQSSNGIAIISFQQ